MDSGRPSIVAGIDIALEQEILWSYTRFDDYRIDTQSAYSTLSPVMTVHPPESKPSGSPPSARVVGGFSPGEVHLEPFADDAD
jgi:hypothetical protein